MSALIVCCGHGDECTQSECGVAAALDMEELW